MTDLLPSWNDTPTKQAILGFVAAVTDESGLEYVPPADLKDRTGSAGSTASPQINQR
jgi:hypothetical protein